MGREGDAERQGASNIDERSVGRTRVSGRAAALDCARLARAAEHQRQSGGAAADEPPRIQGKDARQVLESQVGGDTYIQLIYAGNAVQYPSSVLKAQFYASWLDPISLLVGTYTGWGAKVASWNRQTKMSSGGGSGGHGFVKNYANVVGESIAQDIETHGR